MKYLILLLIGFISFNKLLSQQQIGLKIIKQKIDLSNYKLNPNNKNTPVRDGLFSNTGGTILYYVNGKEHIVSTPDGGDTLSQNPIHLIKKNNEWIIENFYTNAMTHQVLNVAYLDSLGTIALAEDDDRSGGDVWVFRTLGDSLSWQKISTYKAGYSDIAAGDFSGDGLPDVVTYGGKDPNGFMQVFTQTKSGSFISDPTIVPKPKAPPPLWIDLYNSGGAVGSYSLFNNKRPEILRCASSFMGSSRRNQKDGYAAMVILYNEKSNAYDSMILTKTFGIFEDSSWGATGTKFGDFNNDGKKDFAIAADRPDGSGNALQIFLNDGVNNFITGQNLISLNDSFPFRTFIVGDFNHDGWDDICLNPFFQNSRPNFPGQVLDRNLEGQRINLQKFILLNDKGVLKPLNDSLIIKSFPGFLSASFINNQLRLIGYQRDSIYNNGWQLLSDYKSTLIDIGITFCKNLIKPTFNTTKFSFCSGDSLKLSITNVNKGDTLKWYFGTKSDITNIANKTFTDSSKVYVTRTDSLGCMISSDTIQLKKYAIPSSPSLGRDTANNLVASINGITWYKDGIKISDTTQKIKPTSNGIYTATTNQNGCTSALSQGYYYLTNAVANLSNGEYFKVSPNPTNGEVFFNYNIRSSKEIYISVVDINGRTVLLNKKVESGSRVNLGAISKGNYIIQVKDGAGRLIASQKLVKE